MIEMLFNILTDLNIENRLFNIKNKSMTLLIACLRSDKLISIDVFDINFIMLDLLSDT